VLGSVLALGSATAGGVSDFLAGSASRRIGSLQYLFATQAMGLPLAAGFVVLSGASAPGLAGAILASGAGLALAFGLGAFFQAMVVGTISIVAPISATGVVVPVAAGIVRGERPSALQAIGIAGAVVGIVLVSRARADDAGSSSGGRSGSSGTESGVWLALVSAIGTGTFLWLMAPASRHGVAWAILLSRLSPTVACLIALSVTRAEVAALRQPSVAGGLGLCALLGLAAQTMYSLATRHGQLAIVGVLGSMFPAVVVLLAYLVLGERIHRAQRLGVATLTVAVVLMSVG
jgi:drug/metabolite transporter (DMT)-like permease